MQRYYLDNNASTQLAPEVRDAIVEFLDGPFGNPSSVHWFGQQARGRLSKARRHFADFLGVRPSEVFFNSGGTEAANQFIKGAAVEGHHIISSDQEHACVFKTAESCGATFLCPGASGAPSAEQLRAALRDDTGLIILSAANTETGVMADLEGLAAVAEEAKVPLIIDAVGLLGKQQFSIPSGVTGMFFSGHKLHAPKGVGMVFLRRSFKQPSLLIGGSQEHGRRAGTENLPGIVGFAKAIELLEECLPAATETMRTNRDHFEERLRKGLGDIVVHAQPLARLPNTTNIGFPGVDGESLLMHLDMQGVAASHGSACSAGALEPSRVLLNFGLSRELASSSLRFSFSRYTSLAEVDGAADVIIDVVTQLRRLQSAS